MIMPSDLVVTAATGYVPLHEPSNWWLFIKEEDLTGKRIVFDKWSPNAFTWEGVECWLLSEAAVLAVFEKEEEEDEQ